MLQGTIVNARSQGFGIGVPGTTGVSPAAVPRAGETPAVPAGGSGSPMFSGRFEGTILHAAYQQRESNGEFLSLRFTDGNHAAFRGRSDTE